MQESFAYEYWIPTILGYYTLPLHSTEKKSKLQDFPRQSREIGVREHSDDSDHLTIFTSQNQQPLTHND
jgi:hypothetical protein